MHVYKLYTKYTHMLISERNTHKNRLVVHNHINIIANELGKYNKINGDIHKKLINSMAKI